MLTVDVPPSVERAALGFLRRRWDPTLGPTSDAAMEALLWAVTRQCAVWDEITLYWWLAEPLRSVTASAAARFVAARLGCPVRVWSDPAGTQHHTITLVVLRHG